MRHVRLDLPVTKSPLLPFNSMICPRDGPQMANNDLARRPLEKIRAIFFSVPPHPPRPGVLPKKKRTLLLGFF